MIEHVPHSESLWKEWSEQELGVGLVGFKRKADANLLV